MIISYSKKFLFIHVYKVAGTSIRYALSPYGKPTIISRVKRNIFGKPFLGNDFAHHVTSLEVRDKLGNREFNKLFKFAFVRNPWDWQVSLYHFTIQNIDHFQHNKVKKLKNFEEYINWRIQEAMCFQSSFTHDGKGNQLVDFVGHIENIQTDFKQICDHVGIVCKLPVINRSIHKEYEKYYTPITYNLIGDAYSKEIDLFGY